MFTLYFSTDHGKVKSCCHRKLKCHPMQKTCWYEDVIQMFFNVWMRCLFGLFLSSIADHKTLQLTVNYVDLICPHSICIIWPFCEHRWTKMSNSSVLQIFVFVFVPTSSNHSRSSIEEEKFMCFAFLSDPGVPRIWSMGLGLCQSKTMCRLNWCDSGWWT